MEAPGQEDVPNGDGKLRVLRGETQLLLCHNGLVLPVWEMITKRELRSQRQTDLVSGTGELRGVFRFAT